MNDSAPKRLKAIRDASRATDVAVDPAPRRRRRRWIAGIAAAVLVALAVLAWPLVHRWAQSGRTVSLAQVQLGKVTRGTFVRDVFVDGKAVAAVSPTLYSDVNGTVTLHVIAGDTVKKGQVLAVIDSPGLTNKLQQEQNQLQSMQTDLGRERIDAQKAKLKAKQRIDLAGVNLQAAKREMQRAKDAWKYRVISRVNYAKAHDALEAARIRYKHAAADTKLDKESQNFDVRSKELAVTHQKLLVADLRRRVDDLTVKSPVNGVVGNVDVQQKQAVTPNQALFTVVDLSALEIAIQIPESYADGLSLGMPAQITYNDKTYPGKLTSVSPEVKNNEVTGRVRFSADEPAGLKQNQQVSVRIVMDKRKNVLMVPRGAFYDSGGGRTAYVVKNGTAVRTPIVTGAVSVNSVEVLRGLHEGDTIIVSDTSGFDDAATVYLGH